MDGYTEEETSLVGVTLFKRNQIPSVDEKIFQQPQEIQMSMFGEKINQVKHLLRSNKEMEEVCAVEFDQDFQDYIKENEIIIKKRKQEIITIQEAIAKEHNFQVDIPAFVLE